MKKALILIVAVLVFMPTLASAQFYDWDGKLEAQWTPPVWGNPLDHYIWSYEINGTPDSLTGTAITEYEDSVQLDSLGHWAILQVWAVSIFNDTSNVAAVSDTAYYADESGIGPPGPIQWLQGSLAPRIPLTAE